MTVHRVHKFVSSAVRRTSRHVGARTCNMPEKNSVENCSNHLDDSMCLHFLCGAATDPVQEEDECEAHAAFLVEAEGFGVLDCGATTSFGSVESAEVLFS